MLISLAFAAVLLTTPVASDGDTIRDRHTGVRWRVENIDAPETSATRAQCPVEIERGRAAQRYAGQIIGRARKVEALPTGRTDRYGRPVARILLDGRDFGEMMMRAGHAQRWRGRKAQWCPAPAR
jgi:endonuclease YncB( thermonuclease family)